MSWTTPRTWVTNEMVSASIMNVHVRDNFLALIGAFCLAYHNTTQNVSAGNTDALNLNSELYDTASLHDNSTLNTRITIGSAGKYFVHGRSSVSSNNNGTAALHLYKNGSALTPNVTHPFTTAASDWEDQTLQVTTVLTLAVADYVELRGQAVSNTFTFGTSQLMVHGPLAAGN